MMTTTMLNSGRAAKESCEEEERGGVITVLVKMGETKTEASDGG